MIICSSNNIDFIQGVIAYGNEPLITDWRIENSNGVLNILNSKSTNANLAVLEGGNINITGNYNKNNRDVINDTSNYVLSTSNILVSRIRTEVNYTSNYVSSISIGSGGGGSSQWITSNNNIYYNTSNVGIGTFNPSNNLHIYNSISDPQLIIQNGAGTTYSIAANITSTTGVTSLSVPGNSVDKYMRFLYTTTTSGLTGQTRHTITITEPLGYDLLIVGGGGGGGGLLAGGAGAGGLIYIISGIVLAGTYNIDVGDGGNGSVNHLDRGFNGYNSSAFGNIAYGGGGSAGQSWVYNNSGTASGTLQTTSANQGSGAGGTRYKTLGNAGTAGQGNSGGNAVNDLMGAGGGGAGGVGANSAYRLPGNGGIGIYNSITGTSVGYAGGGAGSGQDGVIYGALATEGGGSSGPINGSGGYTKGLPGTSGTGGGGGGGDLNGGGKGGSGVVIFRYRKVVITSAIINLMRGTSSDTNRDYSIGNYGGEYKINTSKQGTSDATFFRIAEDGTMYNAQGTTNFTSASDKRVKDNIEKASYNICYENINNLELYRFNYINNFNNINKDNKQLGFIAQEVIEYFPKAVYSNNYINADINIGNLLSIDVSQINYTLYGAVKKLMAMNEDKEARIKRLENLLNIDTSNIVLDTSNIAIDTSNIAIDTSNI